VQEGPTFETAEQASQHLIQELSMVTVPWQEAGSFLRFSVTYVAADEAAEDALMQETRQRLTRIKLRF
ncbi:MAG: LL-diaminopimelate aminotransferase, partial [Pirellulaceae bacterium]